MSEASTENSTQVERASSAKSAAQFAASAESTELRRSDPLNGTPASKASRSDGRDDGGPASLGAASLGAASLGTAPLATSGMSAESPVHPDTPSSSTRSEAADERLVERMKQAFPSADIRVSTGVAGETRVTLEHPVFGAVDLQLNVGNGGMDVAARVNGSLAAALLRQSEGDLRERVRRHGVALRTVRIEQQTQRSPRPSRRGIDLEA